MIACHRQFTVAALVLTTACTPAPRWIAVAGADGVTLFDGRLRLLGKLPLPDTPKAILFSPDGASLFVAVSPQPGTTVLTRVPRVGGALTGGTLKGDAQRLRLTPDGTVLLAALSGSAAGLAFARAQTLRVEHVAVPCGARDVVLTPSADRAYVICADDRVAEVDPDLRLIVRTGNLPVGNGGCDPGGAGFSANGTVLFVACAASGWLYYLDRVTLASFDSVRVPTGATRLLPALGGRRVVLAIAGAGSVVVVDVPGRSVRAQIPAAGVADLTGAADERHTFLVTSTALIELDVSDGHVLRSVLLPEGSTGVAVWPGPQDPRVRWDNGISASASSVPAERS